ncbi:MAG: hypothetical protein ABI145_15610 [Steroidobacteraceae bacterium]
MDAIIKPDVFRLLAGENELSDYQFGRSSMHHVFCRQCGVRSFAPGHLKEIGGDHVAVQLASQDNVDLQELISTPVGYADGRHDNCLFAFMLRS